MALTPQQVKDGNRLRKQAQRAREKAAELAAAKKAEQVADKEVLLADMAKDLAWAQEQDATETFYKSECRNLVTLLAMFGGTTPEQKEAEDEIEEGAVKKAKKPAKKRTIAPYASTFTLNAIEYEENILGSDAVLTHYIDPETESITLLDGQILDTSELYEVNGRISFRRWLDLRDKARKNLFWLCHLLGMGMYKNAHQMICDMFVQKNFDGCFFPGFKRHDVWKAIGRQKRVNEDGVETRTMLLFAPRGGRKSTIDGVDSVQWLLNSPDVRILIATAVRALANQLFLEIKKYFFLPEDADPTIFQLLFPEYCLTGRDGESLSPLRCPARLFQIKDPSVWHTSMDSSSTGKRCDIRKLDDVVDYQNSDTEETRLKLERKIHATRDLVAGKWGFTDVVATRYFTKDWYGSRMNKDDDAKEPAAFTYLCIPAWYPKPGFETKYRALLNKTNGMFEVTEDMVDLWCHELIPFSHLQELLKEKKEISFKNQQLNIPTDPKTIDKYINQFDEGVLTSQLYLNRKVAIPKGAEFQETIQSWDIAYGENRTSDYSVGTTMDIYRFMDTRYGAIIVEVFYDKWKSSELPGNIVQYFKKYNPAKVYMENSNGVQFLRDNMENFAKLHGSDLFSSNKFILRPVSVKPDAKRDRIKNLEFLLGQGMLQFVEGEWIAETFKQLTTYTGEKSTAYRKDDIPDSISLGVVSHLPRTALQNNPNPEDVKKEEEKRREKENREKWNKRLFGSQSPVQKAAEQPQQPQPQQPRAQFPRAGNFAVLPSSMRTRNGGNK